MSNTKFVTHRGGCHCGAVAFEIAAPARVTVQDCSCSICSMTGYLHLIVPASCFVLLLGGEMLESYTFNTGTAKHLFCKRCGIKSFYVPRSNPDGFSVNLRCLDRTNIEHVEVQPFDGKHWEQAGGALAHLSKDHGDD